MDGESIAREGEYSSNVNASSGEVTMKTWQERILELPKYMLGPVSQALNDFGPNDTDFGTFQFRYNLRSHIAIWILIYSLIFAFGLLMNLKFILWYKKTRKHLCCAHTFIFDLILGNSINDLIIKDLIVLPVSFITMTGVHWILGRHFCKFFPIIQDSCFYSSSLIILEAFYFRYKQVSNCTFNSANKLIEYQSEVKKISSIAVLIVAFAISLVGVIPHTVYIDYADLGYYVGPVYNNTGVCAVNTENRFMDYVKYLFLLFYVIPVVISFSYFSKTIDIIEKWIQSGEEYATTKRIHIHRGSAVEASLAPVLDDDDYDDDDDDDDDERPCAMAPSKRTSFNTDEVSDDNNASCESSFQRGEKRRESRKGNNNYRNTRSSMMVDGYNGTSPMLDERDEDVNKINDTPHVRIHVNKTSDLSSLECDTRMMDDDTISQLPGRQAIERRSFRSNSGCPRLTFNVTSDGDKYTNTLKERKMSLSPRSEVPSDSRVHVSINDHSEYDNEYRRSSHTVDHSNGEVDNSNVSLDDKVKLRSNLDIEQSLQKVMSRILLFQSILLLPFNILRFAKHIIPEKSDLNNVYDFLFLILVGLQFSTMLLIPSLVIHIFAADFDHRRAQLDKLKDSPLIQIERNRSKRQSSRATCHERSRSSLTVDNSISDSRSSTAAAATAAATGGGGGRSRQRAHSTYTASPVNAGSSVLQPRRPSAVVNSSVSARRNTTSSFHRKPSYAIASTSVHHASSNVPSASPLSLTGYSPVSINVKESNSNVNFVDPNVTCSSLNVNTQATTGNMIGKISSASSSSITGLTDPQRRVSPSLALSNNQGNYLQAESMGLRRKSYQQLNLPSNQQMASGAYGHAPQMYQQQMQSSPLSRGHHHRTQSVRVTSYAMRDQEHPPYHRQMANGQSAGRLSLAGLGFDSSAVMSNLSHRGYPRSEV